MKLFIAIAPVVYIDNIGSKVIKEMISNSAIIKGFEMMGPEIMPHANASNPLKAALTKGFLGKALANKGIGDLTDSNPQLID